jgi:hypothetical protein
LQLANYRKNQVFIVNLLCRFFTRSMASGMTRSVRIAFASSWPAREHEPSGQFGAPAHRFAGH